ncbi:uncharacterized protein [Ptychodera flava]|uniref:uncharacterized protein n=1 Tax=Ptychodera flava TaxID=63121 RepID=UPI003969C37F
MDIPSILDEMDSQEIRTAVNNLFRGSSTQRSPAPSQNTMSRNPPSISRKQSSVPVFPRSAHFQYIPKSKTYNMKLCVLKYNEEVITDSAGSMHCWDGSYLLRGDISLESKWNEKKTEQEIQNMINLSYPDYIGKFKFVNVPHRGGAVQLRIASPSFKFSAKALWDTKTYAKTVYVMLDTEHDDPSNESEGPLPVVSINHPSALRSSTIEGTHTGTSEVTEEVDTSVQSIQSTVNSSIDFVDITETENNPSQLNQDESTIAAHHPLSSVEDHDVQTRAREEGQPLLPVMVGQTAQVREEGQPLLPVMVGQTAQVREEGQPLLPVMVGQTAQVREEGQPLLPVMVGQTAQVREEGRCPLSVIAGQTTQSREERQSNEPMRSATTSNTRDNVSTTTSRRRSRSPSPDSILQEPEALTNVKKHKGNQQDDVTLRDIITRADKQRRFKIMVYQILAITARSMWS